MSEKRLVIGAAVNDEAVLAGNLAASPLVADGGAELLVERDRPSAAIAYNAILDRAAGADLVVFAHQDVYLPRGWEDRLTEAIENLEREGIAWGVLGVSGVDKAGRVVGRVWSSGLQREVGESGGASAEGCEPVASLDELLLVVRCVEGLRFDERLRGYHLFGTDMVQTAWGRGLGAFAIEVPVVHNSEPVLRLGRAYGRAYGYMRRKWRRDLPIPTCCADVTRWGWPLWRSRLKSVRRTLLGGNPPSRRSLQPALLARELGYEERPAFTSTALAEVGGEKVRR